MKALVAVELQLRSDSPFLFLYCQPDRVRDEIDCLLCWKTAEQYSKLGYCIGIGGSILPQEERAKDLWEAVRHIPLDRILIGTDAPFILPYCKDVIQAKFLRRARNTSLILSPVIRKISELKDVPAEVVEEETTANVIRVFKLSI